MSCTTRKIIFEVVNIDLKVISKEKITECLKKLELCFNQLMDKLTIVLKNIKIYAYKNTLIVHDEYMVSHDLENILKAFNLNVKQLQGVKGNAYAINSEVFELLNFFKGEKIFDYENPKNDIINQLNFESKFKDLQVKNIINNIKEKGFITVEGKQKITEEYFDNDLRSTTKGEIISDRKAIEDKTNDFMNQVKNEILASNESLFHGTKQIIVSRAKSMGYTVGEVKKKDKVELVLVRID